VELVVRVSVVGGRPVLSISGELDLATLPQLHNALAKSANQQPSATVVVDLDGVYACDDAALGVLLGAAGRARSAGGDMRVVCSPVRCATGWRAPASIARSMSSDPSPTSPELDAIAC